MRFIGRAVRSWRAGSEWRAGEDPRFADVPRTIDLRSDAFAFGEPMPAGIASPALRWSGVPPATRSVVLVAEDVDVPFWRPRIHALAYGLDPATTALDAGALAGDRIALGYNGAGTRSYLAPAPLPGHGPHRYVFTLFALDFVPRFDQPPTRGRLLDAIAGHVLAQGELMGTLER